MTTTEPENAEPEWFQGPCEWCGRYCQQLADDIEFEKEMRAAGLEEGTQPK